MSFMSKVKPSNKKRCNKCKEVKLLSEFHKKKLGKYRCTSHCKICISIHNKQYHTNNKDKRQQYCLNNKAQIAAQHKRYRVDNKDKIDARHKQYRAALCTNDRTTQIPTTDKPLFSDNKLTVLCKQCAIRFQPTNLCVANRIQAYKTVGVENNFYCSDKCKDSCVLFNFHPNQIDPRSKLAIHKTEQQTARNCQTDHLKQLQCDEVGHNYCERCGDIIDVELHHTLPINHYGKDAINSAGHILLCPGCHVELHEEC